MDSAPEALLCKAQFPSLHRKVTRPALRQEQISAISATRPLRVVLRWLLSGLWVIVLFIISGAVGTLLLKSAPNDYQARSVVIAVSTPFPREEFQIAVTLFYTDEVIGPVADQIGTPREETECSPLLRPSGPDSRWGHS